MSRIFNDISETIVHVLPVRLNRTALRFADLDSNSDRRAEFISATL